MSRRCLTCGYDLAGLSPGTRCPECGNTQPARPSFFVPAHSSAPGPIRRLFTTNLYGLAAVTSVLLPPVGILAAGVLLIYAHRANRCVRTANIPADHPFARQVRRARSWAIACLCVSLIVLGLFVVY